MTDATKQTVAHYMGKPSRGKTGLWYRYGRAQAKDINSVLRLGLRGKGDIYNPLGNSGGGNSVMTADVTVNSAILDSPSADVLVGTR